MDSAGERVAKASTDPQKCLSIPGRDFKTMESLYDYISQRLDVSNGVRVIFTLDGKKVPSLEEFEDGASYVASGTRSFAPLAYGQARNRVLQRADEEPTRLVQPVGQKKLAKGGSVSLPGSGGRDDGRVIDVVSSLDSEHTSRVLLNLKTTQTFEEVLRDLGGALNMNGVKKMTTDKGEVVRSFSQLKYDLREVNTFVLEPDDDEPLVRRSSFHGVQGLEDGRETDNASAKVLSRSESAPSLEGGYARYVTIATTALPPTSS
ncbi:hypothetical protein MRX96_004077 [Rhipicephalus microplus]